MNFKTERLEIRPISEEDREAVLDLLTNATVARTYMPPEYPGREEAQPLFHRLVQLSADENRYVAGVYYRGQFIGMMNDTEMKDRQIEMGYAYLPAFYNRGFATEAFSGAIEYLLNHGFEKVLAGAFSNNAASLRVMEKCGMQKLEYTDTVDYRGVTYDCVYYAATKK